MNLTHEDLRKKFVDFFVAKGHVAIPSASLVPQNDPTTLFTGSGMQPFIPYLLGETHPLGTRLVDIQKCFRAEDLDEVGNTPVHDTFFEMMGNWSLGDYFKKEQIEWVFDFFVNEIGLDPRKLYVTVFEGEGEIPKDEEAVKIWQSVYKKYEIVAKEGDIHQVGQENLRIFAYPKKKNWWERSGAKVGDPAGPDSEIFFDTGKPHDPKYGDICHVNCDCRRFIEICNNVFMQYKKMGDGSYVPLEQKNVDVGYGFERILMVANQKNNIFETDIAFPIIQKAQELSGKKYGSDKSLDKVFMVLADHMRASVFLIADGVVPSNKEQGYMLRRLIRRSIRFAKKLNLRKGFSVVLAKEVIGIFENSYPDLVNSESLIISELLKEEEKFSEALDKGLKKLEHLLAEKGRLSGEDAFFIYETYGFPLELILDVAGEVNVVVNVEEFNNAYRLHKESSKSQSGAKFKGGLEGTSEMHVKYHTATHLLHKALREVLGDSVSQMGSNITTERLRFDFSYDKKMTSEQINQVEDIVNGKISEGLPVGFVNLPKKEAEESGALHFFGDKYGDVVKIHYIGENLENAYSKEFCGGPHVKNTLELGKFKIIKEESTSQGVRRIKAVLL